MTETERKFGTDVPSGMHMCAECGYTYGQHSGSNCMHKPMKRTASQSDVMLAEIKARNSMIDSEKMKARYEQAIQAHYASSPVTAAPAARRFNSKLLLTRGT